jgi:hypothetical protein
MDLFVGGLWIGVLGGIIGGGLAGVAVLVWALLQPPKACPNCGNVLPKFRVPSNSREMLWGGTACPECGCSVDRKGQRMEPS